MYTYPTDLIRITEASKMVNLQPGTIYNLTSRWHIPFIKKGSGVWFSKSELEDFNKERKIRLQLKKQNDKQAKNS